MRSGTCILSLTLAFLAGEVFAIEREAGSGKPSSKEVLYTACMLEGINTVKEDMTEGMSEEEKWMARHYYCQVTAGICAKDPQKDPCPRVVMRFGEELGKHGGSLLFQAAFIGDVRLVEVMLDSGAEVDYKAAGEDGFGCCGWTPLMIAAAEGNEETVILLISRGADVNAKNQLGRTSLMFASGYGFYPIVKALLDGGAEPNEVPEDGKGWSALMAASFRGHADVVKLLLERGADPTIKDRDGKTALAWAKMQGHAKVVKALKRSVDQ